MLRFILEIIFYSILLMALKKNMNYRKNLKISMKDRMTERENDWTFKFQQCMDNNKNTVNRHSLI